MPMFKLMCVICLSLLVFASIVHCQDDDDDDDDDDHHQTLDEDASNNFINGFDDSGSGNIDELSGGMFDSDSETDPIDFMDSKRRQSFVRRNFPFFFRRGKNDDDAIIQNNPGSYVSQDGQEHINHGGNFHSSGDDIHSTGGGDGDGGCSGGCDDDHHHHHHDHHDHHDNDRHKSHSSRGGHDHGHGHGHEDHHRRGNQHDDHHRYDHNDFHDDHHDHSDHHDTLHGPHDHHDPHEHLDLAHEQERKYNERLREKHLSEGPSRPKGLAERMQRSTFGSERLRDQPLDPFDPDKRSRYSGYDHSKHALEKGFTPLHPRAALNNYDVDHSFMNHFESSLASDPHNAFPRGSFYGLDGFYGNSRLVRDKLLSPYSLKTASKKMPCDSGCDFDDDKKKKKR